MSATCQLLWSVRRRLWLRPEPEPAEPHRRRWHGAARMGLQLHAFDARVGDGYRMSLFYPADERTFRGKTAEREDRIRVRFVELEPARRIVEAVDFQIADRGFGWRNRGDVLVQEPADAGCRQRTTRLAPGCYWSSSLASLTDVEEGLRSKAK